MSVTTAPPEAEAEALPRGIIRRPSGRYRAKLRGRTLGTFDSVAGAVAALEAARAELGVVARDLPHGVYRQRGGRFSVRAGRGGRQFSAGSFASVAGAIEARDRLRAELGLPPIIAALEPANAPATPAPTPELGELGVAAIQTPEPLAAPEPPPAPSAEPAPAAEPAPREARPLPLTAPPERWWEQAHARIDRIVARVEAEEGLGQFTLPPDPRRRNAPR